MSLFFLWPFLFQQDLVNSSLIAVPLSSVVVNWPEVFCSSHSEPHGRWLLSLAFCGQDISALAWNNILPTTSHFLKKDIVSYSSVAWFFFFLKKWSFSWYWMQPKCDCCFHLLYSYWRWSLFFTGEPLRSWSNGHMPWKVSHYLQVYGTWFTLRNTNSCKNIL